MSIKKLPFQIPKSLASYIEQYEKKPEKTIERFKKQLKRRGPDAIGTFILAWFYYQKDEIEKALECSVKAKSLAPGSPFLEKVHYFLLHPDLFNAWQAGTAKTSGSYNEISSSANAGLNNLIEKLSSVKAKKIELDDDLETKNKNQRPYDQEEVEGIVSQTLAKVHEQQDNNDTALRMYKILKKTQKGSEDFYYIKIKKL